MSRRLKLPPPESAFDLTPAELHASIREPEAVVMEQVREFLALHGWFVLRWQTGLFVGWGQIQQEAAKAREQVRPFDVTHLVPTPVGATPLGKKSFPDLIAIRAKPQADVLLIELKRTGAKPDAEQARMLDRLRKLGFRAVWCDGLTLGREPFRDWYRKNY